MTWYPKSPPPSKKVSRQLSAKFAQEAQFFGFDSAFLAQLFNVPIKTSDRWLRGELGVSPYHLEQLQLKALFVKLKEGKHVD